MARSAILNVLTASALKAGKAVLRDFGELDKLQVSRKGTANFATNADRRSEEILHKELSKARPGFGFMMEESGNIEVESEFRFVIDPIDGTHNFIHAVPFFCISIALEKRLANGSYEAQAGVIYDPIRDEMFTAELHQGAMVNDQRLRVSGRQELDMCMLTAFMAPPESDNFATHVYKTINSHPGMLRQPGATALELAYIAAGRYDGGCYISYKRWDVAAGKLLIREAGGLITENTGEKQLLWASNALIHAKIATALSKC